MIIRYDFTDLTNPFGHHLKVREAMLNALDTIWAYPTPDYRKLTKSLSQWLDLDEGNIVVAAGAAAGIYSLPMILEPAVTGIIEPTFPYYKQAVEAFGSDVIDILLEDDFSFPLSKVKERLPDLDLLFICNPNNPTGSTFAVGEITEIIAEAKNNDCFVVVDEVYLPFADEPDDLTVKNLVNQYPNLAVLGSFSKTLGLPGLRVGYLLTNPNLAGAMASSTQPWPVNRVALQAALASLEEDDFLKESLRKTRLARNLFLGELRDLGIFKVYPCDSNFIMVKTLLKNTGSLIKERLNQKGVKASTLGKYVGLSDDFLQFAVRRPSKNGALIDLLKSIGSEERLVA